MRKPHPALGFRREASVDCVAMIPAFRTVTTACLVTASLALAGCPKGDTFEPPAAPAMPADWKVARDDVADRNKVWEFEYRLEGKCKGVRMTLYQVGGQRVQLNTIVPRDTAEADKMYRILAAKRAPHTFLRKNELLYEFIAPAEGAPLVEKGFEILSR
jgi:hypothetical protein